MELTDSFTLPVSAERLWEVLTDVELIAPCVPGFKLREAADPDYHGAMTIKVGAVSVAYDATITFVERDDEARQAKLAVKGKERRGGGRVNATVTATLSEGGGETTVEMVTDVEVTGRVAQFGRGIIADVSSRLTNQFVEALDARVLRPPSEPEPAAETTAGAGGADERADDQPSTVPSAEGTALDLGALALGPVLRRAAPAIAVLAILALVVRRLTR